MGTGKGRKGKYPEEDLLRMLSSYMEGPCGMDPSRYTPGGFADYLTGQGMPADSNYVRHNRAIAARMAELRDGGPGAAPDGGGADDGELRLLREENSRYRAFIKGFFIDAVCDHLIKRSGEGLEPEQILKPGMAEKAVITPEDDPFETEALKELMDI